jgi:hypothetical protein
MFWFLGTHLGQRRAIILPMPAWKGKLVASHLGQWDALPSAFRAGATADQVLDSKGASLGTESGATESWRKMKWYVPTNRPATLELLQTICRAWDSWISSKGLSRLVGEFTSNRISTACTARGETFVAVNS